MINDWFALFTQWGHLFRIPKKGRKKTGVKVTLILQADSSEGMLYNTKKRNLPIPFSCLRGTVPKGPVYANFRAPSLMTTSYTLGDTPNLALNVS